MGLTGRLCVVIVSGEFADGTEMKGSKGCKWNGLCVPLCELPNLLYPCPWHPQTQYFLLNNLPPHFISSSRLNLATGLLHLSQLAVCHGGMQYMYRRFPVPSMRQHWYPHC